jgi:hypothetical protein
MPAKATPIVKRVVATGRRMKISQKFIPRPIRRLKHLSMISADYPTRRRRNQTRDKTTANAHKGTRREPKKNGQPQMNAHTRRCSVVEPPRDMSNVYLRTSASICGSALFGLPSRQFVSIRGEIRRPGLHGGDATKHETRQPRMHTKGREGSRKKRPTADGCRFTQM